MRSGNLNIKLRPIKLAFIVDINDADAILGAIKINTLLWGGVFNPIIPYFERKPKILAKDFLFKHENNDSILRGYLNAYDPDFVVQLGKCSNKAIDVGGREKITQNDIFSDLKKEGTVSYGISIFEVLNHFYSKELKFVRKKPVTVIKPKLPVRKRLFLSSVFGELPEEVNSEFLENYKEPFGIKTPICKLETLHSLLDKKNMFLRRFTGLYIDAPRNSSHFDDRLLFFMDPDSEIDVIDYWNLRALGVSIIPIPKQIAKTQEVKDYSLKYIDDSFGQSRYNPQIYYTATLQKSRSVLESEAQDFLNFLDVGKDKESNEPKISARYWYPRIWDEWARDKDGALAPDLEVDTAQINLSGDTSDIDFKALTPEFAPRFGAKGTPIFANEIELRTYGDTKVIAEVMPKGDLRLASSIGGYGIRDWRLSNKGLVYLADHPNWSVHMPIPEAEPVFLNWLKYLGWEAQISSSGYVGKQLIKHLGGTWGIRTIANKELLELIGRLTGQNRNLTSLATKVETLNKNLIAANQIDASKKVEEFLKSLDEAIMSSELKQGPILYEELLGEISKSISADRFRRDAKRYLERLIEVNMFRLGVQIQCPICQKNSWYSLEELKYELQCPKCLDKFSPPSHSPNNEMQWAYRPFGPFSLPNLALGNYSVLLTLYFFTGLIEGSVTPSMSFLMKKGTREFEVDLGLLFSWSRFSTSTVIPIFCECKSFWDKFDEKDVKNLEYLGQQTPGAILVFSTFRNKLDSTEKRLLTSLVKKYRGNRKARKPYNQVLILTETELFGEFGPPDSWGQGDEMHKQYAKKYERYLGIDELCDVTQQMYLGVNSWHDEEKEYFDRLMAKRKANKPPVDPKTQV